MTACPFGAINEKSEVLNIFKTIKEKKVKVVAVITSYSIHYTKLYDVCGYIRADRRILGV